MAAITGLCAEGSHDLTFRSKESPGCCVETSCWWAGAGEKLGKPTGSAQQLSTQETMLTQTRANSGAGKKWLGFLT